jgi:hypothetical protein
MQSVQHVCRDGCIGLQAARLGGTGCASERASVGRGLKVGVQQVEVAAARRSVSRGSRRASAGRSRVAAAAHRIRARSPLLISLVRN